MKERPILFSAPMVRALLDGSKTQTRRPVNRLAEFGQITEFQKTETPGYDWIFRNIKKLWNDLTHTRTMAACPYGQPGDRLWVRESFSKIIGQTAGWIETDYKATYKHGDRMGDLMGFKKKWTPSIHMPRDASRITLEIVSVRVERLQEISEAEALAEGIKITVDSETEQLLVRASGKFPPAQYVQKHGLEIAEYASLWEAINGPGSWDANPWVWVVEFKRLTS